MTKDLRALLRSAADPGNTPNRADDAMSRGIRLRWRRRAATAASTVVALAVVGLLAVASAGRFGTPREVKPIGHGSGPKFTPMVSSAPSAFPASPGRGVMGNSDAVPDEPTPVASALPSSAPSSVCAPPVADPARDVERADFSTVDIVNTEFSFDPKTETVRFEHRMRDIDRAENAGGRTFFVAMFDWDGLRYSVDATTNEAGADEFHVERQQRTGAQAPATDYVFVTVADGAIDAAKNTVSISFTLGAFNSGERALSASERKPAPKQLRPGSELWLRNVWTLAQSPTAAPAILAQDNLRLWCGFDLEG